MRCALWWQRHNGCNFALKKTKTKRMKYNIHMQPSESFWLIHSQKCFETQLFRSVTDRSVGSKRGCWLWHFFFCLLSVWQNKHSDYTARIYTGTMWEWQIKKINPIYTRVRVHKHTHTRVCVSFGPLCGTYMREVALLGAPGCVQTE